MKNKMKNYRLPRLKGERVKTMFCYDDCIYTLFKHYNFCNLEFIYLNMLSHKVIINSEDSLFCGIGIDLSISEDLKEYCGIEMLEVKDEHSVGTVHTIADLVSNNCPVIILFNSYYCPWDQAYHLASNTHCFIANGYDEKQKKFSCNDPYYEKDNQLLDLEKGYISGRIFSVVNQIELINGENELYLILDKIDMVEINDMLIKSARKICDYLLAYDKSVLNEEAKNIAEYIQSYGYRYYYFAIGLDLLNEKYQLAFLPTETLKEKALYIFDQWYKLSLLIMKSIFMPKDIDADTVNISFYSKMVNNIQIEMDYLNEVKNLLCGKFQNMESVKKKAITELSDIAIVQTEFIDIQQYCNIKGLSCFVNEMDKADFTGMGEYFFIEKKYSTEIYENGAIPIKFCDFVNKEYDHIICKKQVISLKKIGTARYLILYGCSEWGNYSGDFIITYKDGSRETYYLDYPDWWYINDWAAEKDCIHVAAEFNRVNKKALNMYGKEKCAIYYNVIPLKSENNVENIQLPNCETIHLVCLGVIK